MVTIVLMVPVTSSTIHAQTQARFTARLAWVPISGAERADVGGHGTVDATLDGSTLIIEGTFSGLPAAATVVRLHQGVATGARGPAIANLSVTAATAGRIDGRVTLTATQRNALSAGHLYLQVHSDRGVAPDNANLWGWLL